MKPPATDPVNTMMAPAPLQNAALRVLKALDELLKKQLLLLHRSWDFLSVEIVTASGVPLVMMPDQVSI
ncbi:MAG: hypothetical protein AABO41_20990 [Acidobacteriota bacterium]